MNLQRIHDRPKTVDLFVLSLLTVLLTYQPYFFHGKINLFETGLYLPGIDALLRGEIPYRDFFHLRGPLELFVPAVVMHFAGVHIGALYTYFYLGTVLTMILCVALASRVFTSRYVLYLFTLVLIGRTYPRVVYHIWGGMRYALGILAVWMAVRYLLQRRNSYVFFAGVASAAGFLTSVEIGVAAMISISAILLWEGAGTGASLRQRAHPLMLYAAGCLVVLLPCFVYLASNGAFAAYWDSTLTVVTRMTKVFDDYYLTPYPRSPAEAIWAAVNPAHANFKHMTPAYCFIVFCIYIFRQYRHRRFESTHYALSCIAMYGVILYVTGFRKLGGSQFEMALQPEKIVLFFMLERFYFYLRDQKKALGRQGIRPERQRWRLVGKRGLILFLFVGFFMSSIGYAAARFDRRFFGYNYLVAQWGQEDYRELIPVDLNNAETVNIPRLRGVLMPPSQAKELTDVYRFIRMNTSESEAIFMYPENGAYYFIARRPFVGRFPMATLSWLKEEWHHDLMTDLNKERPRFIFVDKELSPTFTKQYFKVATSLKYHEEMMRFIHKYYYPYHETKQLVIYRLKP